MKFKQHSFLKSISPSFGGDLQKGKRKTFRPIDPKSTIHLVLKSSRAKGVWSLLHRRNKVRIQDLLEKLARMMITNARKGNPQGRFWDSLAFTRIVQWGKDFNRVTRYFIKNELESFGLGTEFSKSLVQRGKIIFESG